MLLARFLYIFPVWAFGAVVFLILLLSGYACQSLACFLRQKGLIKIAEQKRQSAILASALGLLALLMGFTFTMSLNRYEQRRQLVVHEANAISTTYLRLQLLDEPYQHKLSQQLIQYMDTRVQLFDPRNIYREAAFLKQSDGQQMQLWRELIVGLQGIPHDQITGQLLTATNQMFDVGAERLAAQKAHIPLAVLKLLILYAAIAAGLQGFLQAPGPKHHYLIPAILQLLISMVISMIVDLDFPRKGTIIVAQEPIHQVQASILTYEAQKPDSKHFGVSRKPAGSQ